MVVENALVWGIKSSWVAYIARMNDGAVTTSGGADKLATGEFVFPIREVRDEAVVFAGAVEFSGHFGMLSVRFAEPAITRVGGLLELSVLEDDPDAPSERRTILTLGGASESPGAWEFTWPVLTSLGADLFFDNYRPGTQFDPVVIPAHAIPVGWQRLTSLEEV